MTCKTGEMMFLSGLAWSLTWLFSFRLRTGPLLPYSRAEARRGAPGQVRAEEEVAELFIFDEWRKLILSLRFHRLPESGIPGGNDFSIRSRAGASLPAVCNPPQLGSGLCRRRRTALLSIELSINS